MQSQINVTKPFLPPLEEYDQLLKKVWVNQVVTNQGPFLQEFEVGLKDYLDVSDMHVVSNGTVALQIALSALGLTDGEIITTPFTYVATTSSILWERCKPVFADIDPCTLNINPEKISELITPKTKAIMAVHVFGIPCEVEKLEQIAKKHKLKVIYDSAHGFGAKYKNKSLLSFGDISTCSFHATKPFNTFEGGCLVAKDGEISKKVELIKRFGHDQYDHKILGVNAKMSELHAIAGVINLRYIDEIILARKKASKTYDQLISDRIFRPDYGKDTYRNYAYYPVVFDSEDQLKKTVQELESKNIYPKRYFYPSLNLISYIKSAKNCPVSESVSSRSLCLPLHHDLSEDALELISKTVNLLVA